ncbi:MAG: DUF2791 family P-loop domain-containing protein [Thermoplasmata archaeon]|nr:DUF2791 family P-loop domain-containing protein [Thermoplasmata archaeon]
MTYEAFNLDRNPFLEESPEFEQIDREDVEEKLRGYLSDAITAGTPQIIVVLGEYGMGKTFLTRNLVQNIKDGKFLDSAETRSLGVYFRVTTPKLPPNYLAYVYGQVVEGIGRGWFRATMKKIRDESTEGEIGVTRELSVLDSDYRQALCRFGGPVENLAWRYLSAGSLSVSEMRTLKVEGKLTSDDKALSGMLNLLRFVELTGYRAILLFIDELEYIFSVTSTKRLVQVMNTFKDLYDQVSDERRAGNPGASFHFIFASTPSGYHDITETAKGDAPAMQAFQERVFQRVNLRPFSTKETFELVRNRLKVRRLKPDEPDDLHPFDEVTISEVGRVAEGIPRRIIRLCAYALIDAAEREITTLDRTTLRRVLEYYPWAKETVPPTTSP